MVICQYFLQGRCAYGDNCRYEHDPRYLQQYYNAPQERQFHPNIRLARTSTNHPQYSQYDNQPPSQQPQPLMSIPLSPYKTFKFSLDNRDASHTRQPSTAVPQSASSNVFGASKQAETAGIFNSQSSSKNIFVAEGVQLPTTRAPTQGSVFRTSQEQRTVTKPPDKNIFGNTEIKNAFAKSTASAQSKSVNTVNVYSSEDAVSKQDVDMFLASAFSFGLIPAMPPPKSLC